MKEIITERESCQECGGTGSIPFVNKAGKVRTDAFVYCPACHEDKTVTGYALPPEAFDFPISFSSYRTLCQIHGWKDPGDNAPTKVSETENLEQEAKDKQIVAPHRDDFAQLQGRVNWLQGKLEEHVERSKKKKYTIT